MPDTLQQINAVLSAPIPFFFALLVIAGATWGAFRWAYHAVIEKRKTLYELSTLEAQHAAQAATRREAELKGTIEQLTELIKTLQKQKDQFPSDVQLVLENMTNTSSIASSQLMQLGNANTAVSEALGRQGRLTSAGDRARFVIDETGISVLRKK